MKPKLALTIIIIISMAGMIFSGYLSYSELFAKVCALGGTCTSIAKIPACVYGFIMYLVVFIISLIGLISKKQ